jgi:hypothetical protein
MSRFIEELTIDRFVPFFHRKCCEHVDGNERKESEMDATSVHQQLPIPRHKIWRGRGVIATKTVRYGTILYVGVIIRSLRGATGRYGTIHTSLQQLLFFPTWLTYCMVWNKISYRTIL